MKKKKRNVGLTIVIIILIIIMAVCGYIFLSKFLNDQKSQRQYAEITQKVVRELPKEKFEEDDGPPISIDWDALRKINEDIIGWIYIECIDVSYPVMKTDDNDFYLHRDMYKNYMFAGSIFLDMNNTIDFSDPNSVLYGHNMIDGSMFGRLWHITYQNAAADNPYFWILTPQGDYKYQIFTSFETSPYDKTYTFFKRGDKTFKEWAMEMETRSLIQMPAYLFDNDDYVATLSTCGATGNERTIVMGVCVNGPVKELPSEHPENKNKKDKE